MPEPSLFDQPPAQRHSLTSVAAAESIEASVSAPRERVRRAIETYGPVTDEHIAVVTGLSPNTARPRRVELVAAGIVMAHHATQTTASGRQATAWVLSSGF